MAKKDGVRFLEKITLAEENEAVLNQEFEFVQTGKQYTSRYGEFQFSVDDLQEMADNFNSDVIGVELAVDVNHDPEKKAYAWIKPQSLRVAPSSKSTGEMALVGQLYRYTPEGEQLVKTGAYRYFSIELRRQYTRFIDGVKRTYRNVLSGLALTNMPAVKGMAPTYSDNDPNMIVFNKYASLLASKDVVLSEEKDVLKDAYTLLSEDEQAEHKALYEEILTKSEGETDADEAEEAQEEKKEDTQEEDASEEGDKELSEEETTKEESKEADEANEEESTEEEEKEAEEEGDKELSETVSLSEVMALREEVATLREEKDAKELSEMADSMLLSDKQPVGFNAESKTMLTGFMKTLSYDQRKKFKELMSKVVSVDLTEHGSSKNESLSLSEKAEARAAEIMKANPKLKKHEALGEAYAELV